MVKRSDPRHSLVGFGKEIQEPWLNKSWLVMIDAVSVPTEARTAFSRLGKEAVYRGVIESRLSPTFDDHPKTRVPLRNQRNEMPPVYRRADVVRLFEPCFEAPAVQVTPEQIPRPRH